MKKRTLMAVSAFAFAGVMSASPALAAPTSGLEGLGKPISDDALGNMRGKFVAPNGISYFGIVMSSSWQGADGITTAATLLFSIEFAAAASGGHVTPQLMISWSRECPDCGDDSMDVTSANSGYVALTSNGGAIPIGSLNTATGVVQTQQIAGSDNSSRNVMAIQIVPAGTLTYDTTGMTALTGKGDTEHFDDGDTLQFSYSDHQLGLSMTDQGGALQQSVNGNIGQIAQNVLISGNDIIANNSMGLMIGIDPSAAARTLSVQGALTAMKGMGF
jgi:hypothetical protein